MEFAEYFKKILRVKRLSKAELGRRIGKTQPYIYHLCRGTKPIPKPDVMTSIIKAVHATKEEAQKLMDFSYQRILGQYAKFFTSSKGIELTTYSSPVQEIPILSWVSAAHFSDMGTADDRDNEGRIHTDLKGKRLFALKVKNDCMEPEFMHGDIIIVDPDVSWENGDYVVARLNHDDEATFKQLKIYKNKIVLHPLNYPVFDDIRFGKKDFDKKVTIIGKVVEKKKRY